MAKKKTRIRKSAPPAASRRGVAFDNVLPVTLDPATMAWLVELSRESGIHPRRIVATILHDIRVDDEAAHVTLQ